MREFKKPRKEFAVYIVENQKIQTKRSPVPRTDAVRKSAPKAGLNHELFIGGGHRYNEKVRFFQFVGQSGRVIVLNMS